MNRRTFVKTLPAFAAMAGAASSFVEEATGFVQQSPGATEDLPPITLPKPERDGGKSVLAALWERKTNRNISPEKLPPQVLSNVLWAAFGVNRESGPFGQMGRTAASASNSQEIDLYVALPEGIYLYEAAAHRLAPVVAGDQRAKLGGRGRGGGAAAAPVNLIFVVDIARFGKARLQEPGLQRPGDSEGLLQRRHGPDRRERLPVGRVDGPGRLVPQLQQVGPGGAIETAARPTRALRPDRGLSGQRWARALSGLRATVDFFGDCSETEGSPLPAARAAKPFGEQRVAPGTGCETLSGLG